MLWFLIVARLDKRQKQKVKSLRSVSSDSTMISTSEINRILERLKYMQNRQSTAQNYLCIWCQFNRFIIKLDVKPSSWEERTSLFVAQLIDDGMQSSSVRSYVSAIKRILVDDGYLGDDKKILLTALIKACKLLNDCVRIRLPMQYGLLELILFEIERHFTGESTSQTYLITLYQALFALGYYGLMRVGELTLSQHTIKARNVHLVQNKDKLLVVLYSSKTHDKRTYPQQIKIISNTAETIAARTYWHKNFCPFQLVGNYLAIRQEYEEDNEPFFIFRDGAPVTANQARTILKRMLKNLGLNESLYDMHSLRIGRCSDMVHKFNFSISEVKRIFRWKSSCVFHYIRG